MTSPGNSAHPPGPKREWLGLEQLTNPLGRLIREKQRHGDIVYFPNPRAPAWLLTHPDHAQHVLADNATNYISMAGTRPNPLLGKGLFAAPHGDSWLRQRRLVQPVFHRPRLARMVEGMAGDVQVMAERWASHVGTGEPVELLSEMRRLVVGMLGTSVFSSNMYESNATLRAALDYFTRDIHGPHDSVPMLLAEILTSILGMPIRGSRSKRFLAAVEQVNTIFYGLIAERRQAPAGKDDILAMLLEARDTQGVALTDTEVRDELVSLYVGGHESTAVALTWTAYELALNPDVQRRVRDELTTVLGGQPPTFESLQNLPYTRAVVDETLRVHPPAWQLVRRAAREDQLGGWTVQPRTLMVVSPYLLHRHPDFWKEPERFLPERFLPGQKEGRHRYAYLPFGAGQRQCVGNGYTLTLLTVVLATLLPRFELRLAPDYQLVPMSGSTHRPRNGVLATLTRAG
jgi:cytochrome P450